ncbi:hypothetical protein CLV56_0883 [Mumia flava]|uniref:Carbon monoxide dehydrogenase subunit G n=1 Tax=Mumia flava TaxID=1348852 RepID=A0A0B2B0D7_9ACTN|nr:carbon monoxide dehydrogenase subunit G [Mumia flava]PJJ56672.1 hypothetical protein CLV56_0883 [Mumia flava]
MKVSGSAVVKAPVHEVWTALLDPAVLVETIPGCESLSATGENAYAMTVSAGVAAIRGTYAGTCTLADLVEHESLTMHAEGAGAPGTIATDVAVRFEDLGDGTTAISYDADAVVGGMIGGVGQRMLTAVSKRMAGEFFGAVDDAITQGMPAQYVDQGSPLVEAERSDDRDQAQPGLAPSAETGTFVRRGAAAAPAGGAIGSADDFVKGAVLGGALVLVGVVVGSLLGRRKR